MTEEPRSPTEMTDDELIAEWNAIDYDSDDTARADVLADELEKRNLDL